MEASNTSKHRNDKGKKDNLRACICEKRTERSFVGKVDVMVGVFISVAFLIFLLVVKQVFLVPFLFLLLLLIWILLFIGRLLRGHSAKCAARWAITVIFGAIGGFWFLGF